MRFFFRPLICPQITFRFYFYFRNTVFDQFKFKFHTVLEGTGIGRVCYKVKQSSPLNELHLNPFLEKVFGQVDKDDDRQPGLVCVLAAFSCVDNSDLPN